MVSPQFKKTDRRDTSDFSWMCKETASLFHNFYTGHGLFSCKNIDLNQKKIKFGFVQYSCDLYQKKYAALFTTVKKKGFHSKGAGLVVAFNHWKS
jgi:hypothetical protein